MHVCVSICIDILILLLARAALQTCDQWGTVSTSYRDDLIRTSPLGALLMRYPQPFGKQNGIRLEERLELLKTVAKDHEEAKAKLQKKYFGESDPNIPILAFIGRIVLQKGKKKLRMKSKYRCSFDFECS